MKIKLKNFCELFNEYLVATVQSKKLPYWMQRLAFKLIEVSLKYRSWTPAPPADDNLHKKFSLK